MIKLSAGQVYSIGAAALAVALVIPSPAHRGPVRHGHAPARHRVTCEQVQIEVQEPTGMPGAYTLTLCGDGIPADTIVCPSSSSTLPAPGTILACRLG